jgi:hypothetical protein
VARSTQEAGRLLAACCLAMIIALLVVGAVAHEILRHLVQTAPLWIAVILGLRRSESAKWVAIPSFVVWFFLMLLIWLYLLGWSNLLSGTFTPVETAMTLVVCGASILGFAIGFRARTATRTMVAVALLLGVAVLDVVALRISFLPMIAHR